jgi:hypothetical protein
VISSLLALASQQEFFAAALSFGEVFPHPHFPLTVTRWNGIGPWLFVGFCPSATIYL